MTVKKKKTRHVCRLHRHDYILHGIVGIVIAVAILGASTVSIHRTSSECRKRPIMGLGGNVSNEESVSINQSHGIPAMATMMKWALIHTYIHTPVLGMSALRPYRLKLLETPS